MSSKVKGLIIVAMIAILIIAVGMLILTEIDNGFFINKTALTNATFLILNMFLQKIEEKYSPHLHS